MTKQEKVSLIAIVINICLTLIKFLLASYTQSVALLAEAYHSFTDILSSSLVFTALLKDRLTNTSLLNNSNRETGSGKNKKSRIFMPGGWENKVAIGIGIFLFVIALGVLGKVRSSMSANIIHPIPAAIVIGFMALCSYILYRFELQVGSETGSTALIADAHHAKTDMLASLLIITVFVGERYGLRIDRPAAAVIGVYILISSCYVLTRGIRSYISFKRGRSYTGGMVYEEVVINFLYRIFRKIHVSYWNILWNFFGSQGSLEDFKKNALKRIPAIIIILGFLAYAASGIFVLQPSEEAILERFGKPLQRETALQPGVHYRVPWPVDRVRKMDVNGIRRLSIGYKTKYERDLILWTNAHYVEEIPLLTGENSFLDVAMHVHYRISDLYDYLYRSTEPDLILEQFGNLILSRSFGISKTFEILTSRRDELERDIKQELQGLMDTHRLGLEIIEITFRDIHPPTEVAPSFEDVVSAQEDFETYVEEARGYAKDLIPRARGDSFRDKKLAESYAGLIVAQANGKAGAFSLIQEVFNYTKDITQKRLLLECFEKTLSKTTKYILLPNESGITPELWFSTESRGKKNEDYNTLSSTEDTYSTFSREDTGLRSEEDLLDLIEKIQKEELTGGKK